MTVCANRSDDPGFFTSCTTACVCATQLKAELASNPNLDNQENR